MAKTHQKLTTIQRIKDPYRFDQGNDYEGQITRKACSEKTDPLVPIKKMQARRVFRIKT
jgi:hypothetical protein